MGGGAAVIVAAGGTYWFQPWKLVVDERVEEAAPQGAQVLHSGSFRSLEHETSGTALLLRAADGGAILRLEDLRTSNGPELVVMLSATPATEDAWSAYDDGDFVIVAPLKGNIGSQEYPLPEGLDITRFRSAVVWCNRFSVGFGAAPLAAQRR